MAAIRRIPIKPAKPTKRLVILRHEGPSGIVEGYWRAVKPGDIILNKKPVKARQRGK